MREAPQGEGKAAAPQADAAPDLVRRDLGADGPDRARFADIAYARTHQGWPCLAVVMGICDTATIKIDS